VLFQLSTGGGKTALASSMLKASSDKGNVAFFLVHRRNLIRQTAKTLKKFGIHHSYIAAGFTTNQFARVFLCSIDTLRNRLDDRIPVPNIVFVDECHLSASPSWSKVIDYFKSKGAWIVGLSATPSRADGKGLDMHFTAMVKGPSMKWLIENKFLSEYKLYEPSMPDVSGVEIVNGEYNSVQLTARMDEEVKIVGDAIKHYKELAHGKRAIGYSYSIKRSKEAAAEFTAAGIPAAHIDGKTPEDEQKRIIEAFARREIWVLFNCALITVGFDLAEQVGEDVVVECIIDFCPTASLPAWLQKIGRGLRYDGTTHILLDHAGNRRTHGKPCEDRDWTLKGREKKNREPTEKTIAVRQCPKCQWSFKPLPACPQCKYVFPIQYRKVDEVDGELKEMDEEDFRKMTRMQQGMAKDVESLVKVGISKGMQPGKAVKWARIVMAHRNKKRGKR